MPARDRRLSLLGAALALLIGLVHGATGAGADALIAVPALLLLIPLVAGRYVGEARLARLVRRAPCPAHRRDAAAAPRRPRRRALPRGGRLIAAALARRGPPRAALAVR